MMWVVLEHKFPVFFCSYDDLLEEVISGQQEMGD